MSRDHYPIAVAELVVASLALLIGLSAWIFPEFWHQSFGENSTKAGLWIIGVAVLVFIYVFDKLLRKPKLTLIAPAVVTAPDTMPLPTEEPKLSTPDDARTSLDAFIRLRPPGDGVVTRRQFIQEWSGQSVCWEVYVIKLIFDRGDIKGLLCHHENKKQYSNRLLLSKFTIPGELLPVFDTLRKGDKVIVKGTIDDPYANFDDITLHVCAIERP